MEEVMSLNDENQRLLARELGQNSEMEVTGYVRTVQSSPDSQRGFQPSHRGLALFVKDNHRRNYYVMVIDFIQKVKLVEVPVTAELTYWSNPRRSRCHSIADQNGGSISVIFEDEAKALKFYESVNGRIEKLKRKTAARRLSPLPRDNHLREVAFPVGDLGFNARPPPQALAFRPNHSPTGSVSPTSPPTTQAPDFSRSKQQQQQSPPGLNNSSPTLTVKTKCGLFRAKPRDKTASSRKPQNGTKSASRPPPPTAPKPTFVAASCTDNQNGDREDSSRDHQEPSPVKHQRYPRPAYSNSAASASRSTKAPVPNSSQFRLPLNGMGSPKPAQISPVRFPHPPSPPNDTPQSATTTHRTQDLWSDSTVSPTSPSDSTIARELKSRSPARSAYQFSVNQSHGPESPVPRYPSLPSISDLSLNSDTDEFPQPPPAEECIVPPTAALRPEPKYFNAFSPEAPLQNSATPPVDSTETVFQSIISDNPLARLRKVPLEQKEQGPRRDMDGGAVGTDMFDSLAQVLKKRKAKVQDPIYMGELDSDTDTDDWDD